MLNRQPLGWLGLLVVWGLLLLVACGVAEGSTNVPANQRVHSRFVARSWQVEDGLPHNAINAILQTRDGYLWIATNDGLARFDGVRFTVFRLQEGLPSLEVQTLLEDAEGALWIGTSQGLCRLRQGRIETWTTRDGLAGNDITTLAQEKTGAIWIGTVTGISIWKEGRIETLGQSQGLADKRVRVMMADADGGVWVSMFYQGLIKWEGGRFLNMVRPPGLSQAQPLCLMQDRRGDVWAGLARGVVLRFAHGQWRQYNGEQGLPPNNILDLVEGADGTIWAATGNSGLFGLAGGGGGDAWKRADFDGDAVNTLWADREENVWVGTRARGLTRLKPNKVSVVRILEGGVEAVPRTLAEAEDGTLWAGTTSQGLFRIRAGEAEPFLDEPPVLAYPYVSAVLATSDGSVWWGAGPALFQWKGGAVQSAYTNEYKGWLREDRIRVLCEDSREGLWLGTQNGQIAVLRQGSFTVLSNAQTATPVTALLQEEDGGLLVGSYGGGLARIQDGRRIPVAWKQAAGSGAAPPAVGRAVPGVEPRGLFVLALHRDRDGVLWIGTEGAGLCRLERGEMTAVSSRNGLINDTIAQIVEDDAGNLWLGSYRGILRVGKRELGDFAAGRTTFVHPLILNRSDGLPSDQTMRGFNAGLKTRSGQLAFSTDRGVAIIDPGQEWTTMAPPIARLEDVVVDGVGRGAEVHSVIDAGGVVVIPPGKRRVEFHYTGLSLSAPESVRFRWQLEGVDGGWIEAGQGRVAACSLLPPGSYRFLVTACDNSGVWSEQPAVLRVRVEPFFWEVWWFRLPLAVGMVALFVAVVRYLSIRRLRLRLARLEQESAVQKDRARIAKDLHDDLGAHLSQIAALSELAQTDYAEPAQARGHLDLIFRTARSAARSLDEIVWAVNPRNDSLDRFAGHLCTYAPDFLRAAGIRCQLDVPMDIPSILLPAKIRHHLYLGFKEGLHNVVKHAGCTEVWVRLSVTDQELALIIEDNGRGFDGARERVGDEDGLGNLRQRMSEIGGVFEHRSRPGQGTQLRLVAPMSGRTLTS